MSKHNNPFKRTNIKNMSGKNKPSTSAIKTQRQTVAINMTPIITNP